MEWYAINYQTGSCGRSHHATRRSRLNLCVRCCWSDLGGVTQTTWKENLWLIWFFLGLMITTIMKCSILLCFSLCFHEIFHPSKKWCVISPRCFFVVEPPGWEVEQDHLFWGRHFWCFFFFVTWCSQFVRAFFTTERNKHINLSVVTVISGSSRLSLGNRFSTYKRGKFTIVCQRHWAVTIQGNCFSSWWETCQAWYCCNQRTDWETNRAKKAGRWSIEEFS